MLVAVLVAGLVAELVAGLFARPPSAVKLYCDDDDGASPRAVGWAG